MEDTAKYLIHASFVADGVIERSDVVGAVFGQTEGLLGDELELRDLQESSKLGRIDVEVESKDGQSHGDITIASSLDRVETATLGAALEAIERIGPSHARVEIERIEDVRAAKRRKIVDRAKELLATAFDESVMDSRAILEEVRESIRVEDITEYEGLPAGPHVERSDAIIVVEGRADVLTLLRYGIKNAIAVEGTNVPSAVADLTRGKTVTTFLDGDRGGDLIRQELAQVGDLDYVALPPEGQSVEDLSRQQVHLSLRDKVPFEAFQRDRSRAIPDSTGPVPTDGEGSESTAEPGQPAPSGESQSVPNESNTMAAGSQAVRMPEAETEATETGGTEAVPSPTSGLESLADHVAAVEGNGTVRMLDDDLDVISEHDAADAFEVMDGTNPIPRVVIVDAAITQRLVDIASQRGISTLVGESEGEFVKQPTGVRVRTFEAFD